MIKNILVLIFSFVFLFSYGQENITITYEEISNGFKFYVDSKEYCPTTLKLNFILTNMSVVGNEGETSVTKVIKPRIRNQLIATLRTSKKTKPFNFSFDYVTSYGDYSNDTYDSDYPYYLPFNIQDKYSLIQGYNGSFSHQNENALDFSMPIGTEVTAIRKGVVVKVVDSNDINCATRDCVKFNNHIVVYHSDGTFAEYVHIKQNGSEVKVGDKVDQGQLIGYSGNVGYSSAPHLHVSVFRHTLDEKITLKTKLKINSGEIVDTLIEREEYAKNY